MRAPTAGQPDDLGLRDFMGEIEQNGSLTSKRTSKMNFEGRYEQNTLEQKEELTKTFYATHKNTFVTTNID